MRPYLFVVLALASIATAQKSCELKGNDDIIARSCASRSCSDKGGMRKGRHIKFDCYCTGDNE